MFVCICVSCTVYTARWNQHCRGEGVFIEGKAQSSLSSISGTCEQIVEVDGTEREEEESSFLSMSVLIPPRRPSHHCRHRVKQVANNNKGNALKAGIVDCHCRGSFKKNLPRRLFDFDISHLFCFVRSLFFTSLSIRAVPFGSQWRLFGCLTSNAKMEQMAVTTKELGWIVFVVCP